MRALYNLLPWWANKKKEKKNQGLSGSTVPEGDNNNTAACQYISHTCVRVCVFV